MKKIIVFAYSLRMGGAEKVLVDYINVFKEKYKVDIALIQPEGELLEKIPQDVNVISFKKNIIDYFFFRFIPMYRACRINKLINKNDYDIAVGFLEGRSATWVTDIKKDVKKIAWVHCNVEKINIGISDKEAKQAYSQLDNIIAVSDEVKQSLTNKYKVDDSKITVLHNIVNEDQILSRSKELELNHDKFTFVCVGKLRPEKRQDKLVTIAKELKKEGYNFKIQLIGDGPEYENIKRMISDYGVEDYVEMVGLRTNPYPYIRAADCFVLPSDSEGYSIAIMEALTLKKLVIATNVPVLDNGKYGIVSSPEVSDFLEKMRDVIDGKDYINIVKNNLENYKSETQQIKQRLFKLLEGDVYENK